MTLSHMDRLELELARAKDDLRRARLELGKAKASARDALNALNDYGDPYPDVTYSLAQILDLDRPHKEQP